MKKLAVFDIDGTIFRSSLVIELLYELIEHSLYPKSILKFVEKDYQRWLNRQAHYEGYINKIVEAHISHIKDVNVSKYREVEQIVVQKHKGKVYRFTRDLISQTKKEGYFLFALSGSPLGIVEKFAKEMGFDGWLGSEYEIIDGVFTGRVLADPFSNGKDKALHEYLVSNNINADLSKSLAVGDSFGDIPLLSMVGNPIAFNPDLKLAAIAKTKNWRVVVERKDVIYELKNFEFIKIH